MAQVSHSAGMWSNTFKERGKKATKKVVVAGGASHLAGAIDKL